MNYVLGSVTDINQTFLYSFASPYNYMGIKGQILANEILVWRKVSFPDGGYRTCMQISQGILNSAELQGAEKHGKQMFLFVFPSYSFWFHLEWTFLNEEDMRSGERLSHSVTRYLRLAGIVYQLGQSCDSQPWQGKQGLPIWPPRAGFAPKGFRLTYKKLERQPGKLARGCHHSRTRFLVIFMGDTATSQIVSWISRREH